MEKEDDGGGGSWGKKSCRRTKKKLIMIFNLEQVLRVMRARCRRSPACALMLHMITSPFTILLELLQTCSLMESYISRYHFSDVRRMHAKIRNSHTFFTSLWSWLVVVCQTELNRCAKGQRRNCV